MLSNKDFAQLLSSGSGNKLDDGGKVRFDLKQIKQWDNQIKSKFKTKESSTDDRAEKQLSKKNDTSTLDEVNEPGYRDRAEERRLDANPDYDPESINAVSMLDVEKSKFLGGDVDHTHLVKGLDYALLRKMRHDVEQHTKALLTDSNDILLPTKDLKLYTDLGRKVKGILLDADQRSLSQTDAMNTLAVGTGTGTGTVASRITYEFDLSFESDAELPVQIARSKQVRRTKQSPTYTYYTLSQCSKTSLTYPFPSR